MKKKTLSLVLALVLLLSLVPAGAASAAGEGAPVITTFDSLPQGTVGLPYSQQFAATGSEPITWTKTSGDFPPGLALSASGEITGTPSKTGMYYFYVEARNTEGYVSKRFSIQITADAAPVITTSDTLAQGTVGLVYGPQQLAATGPIPITWAKTSGDLPPGLALSASGEITGTPSKTGTYYFYAEARNIGGSSSKRFSIQITADAAPVITTAASLPQGTVGIAYTTVQLAATGPTPITWSRISGDLPPGITLSGDGKISGTPSQTGTYYFTVQAQNVGGASTLRFSMLVTADAAPVITTTESLPPGSVGAAYSQQLAATGEVPITWTRTSGTLPPGLSISSTGLISGTPSEKGSHTFTIEARNVGGYITKRFTLTIAEASAAPNIETAADWAREGINEAYAKGFIPAELQNNFNYVINRQEFCRMAVRWVEYATGKNIDTVLSEKGAVRNTNAFTDTSDPDILAAFALGITSGTGNNQFTPMGQFNREQAATMIMNTCKAIGANVSNPPDSGFSDLNAASDWAKGGINFVRANTIMQGTGSNNFSPKATYTIQESILTFNNIKPDTLPGL